MDVKGMREILFRGKRIDNGEWVEGYLYEHQPALVGIVSENDVPEPSKWFIARTGFADWNMPRPVEFVEIDPSTVGQYTGLTDKNGKKIFEGDICRVCLDPEVRMGYIQFDERTASFNLHYNDYRCNTFLDIRLAENKVGDRVWVDVIGNIHDNPELLEDFNKEV